MVTIYDSGDEEEGKQWAIGGVIFGAVGFFITLLVGGTVSNATAIFCSIAGIGEQMGMEKGDDDDE